MKTLRIPLAWAATVAFIISFFLPAFNGDSGFACFGYCWDTLLGRDPLGIHTFSGAWFYYSGFVISNLLFVLLVIARFATARSSRLRLIVSVICFLQVLSFLVLTVAFAKPSQIAQYNIGYYLWLIAFGLLVGAHSWQNQPESVRAAHLQRKKGTTGPNQFILSRALGRCPIG